MTPDYCNTCSYIFKKMASCPNPAILNGEDQFQAYLEYFWAFASVLPLFINLGQALYFFGFRSTRNIFIILAMVLHGLINERGIKRMLAESRPYGSCATSYGLPSGHSGFASGLATWLVLEMVFLHDNVPFKKGNGYKLMTWAYLVMAPFIPISRYYLNYHSIKQCIWGTLTGIVMYGFFFFLMMVIVEKDEGRFWSSLTRRLRHSKVIEENMLGFVGSNGQILLNDVEATPNQENEGYKAPEMKILLPSKSSRGCLIKNEKSLEFPQLRL